jgi:glycerol-3-phosphate acyltransferase PlsY
MTNYLIIGAIAYFFGAIPFSFLIGLIFYRTDIRKHGSGNIGSTNLYRVLGPIPGVIGYILDTLKGALSVALLLFFFPTGDPNLAGIIAATMAIIGHMFPVYLLFRGGKGVAVAFGACLVLSPWAALCSILMFAITVLIWRYMSLGSIVGTVSFIVFSSMFSYFFEAHFNYWLLGFTMVLMLLVIFAHRSNIKRLLKGEEDRFDFKRKRSKEAHKEQH